MAWSTRQLSELSGVTVKAIRHYHQLGLLDEPDRALNGYKQYQGAHLVRVLQIRRLSQRGFSLAQIEAMDSDLEHSDMILALDAQLSAEISRLTAVRAELSRLLEHGAAADLPADFAPMSARLSESHRSLLSVYDTVFSQEGKTEFARMLTDQDAAEQKISEEFERLPPDADDEIIDDLARRMAPMILNSRKKHPWAASPIADSPQGVVKASEMLAHTLVDVYHPAQIQVLGRIDSLLRGKPATKPRT